MLGQPLKKPFYRRIKWSFFTSCSNKDFGWNYFQFLSTPWAVFFYSFKWALATSIWPAMTRICDPSHLKKNTLLMILSSSSRYFRVFKMSLQQVFEKRFPSSSHQPQPDLCSFVSRLKKLKFYVSLRLRFLLDLRGFETWLRYTKERGKFSHHVLLTRRRLSRLSRAVDLWKFKLAWGGVRFSTISIRKKSITSIRLVSCWIYMKWVV